MRTIPIIFNCPDCRLAQEFQVTPARSAPPCSNPSSPAFSDSGDAAEVNGPDHCVSCQHEFEQDWDAIESKAYDQCPDNDYDGPELSSLENVWDDVEKRECDKLASHLDLPGQENISMAEGAAILLAGGVLPDSR